MAPELGDRARCRAGTGNGLGLLSGAVSASVARVAEAGVGVLQDVEAFGVRGHQAVLDAVVDHLHEVAGAVSAAMQIAVRRSAAGRADRRHARAGRERGEDRLEARDGVAFAADHQAVAALEAEHAAAGADIDVVDARSRAAHRRDECRRDSASCRRR